MIGAMGGATNSKSLAELVASFDMKQLNESSDNITHRNTQDKDLPKVQTRGSALQKSKIACQIAQLIEKIIKNTNRMFLLQQVHTSTVKSIQLDIQTDGTNDGKED